MNLYEKLEEKIHRHRKMLNYGKMPDVICMNDKTAQEMFNSIKMPWLKPDKGDIRYMGIKIIRSESDVPEGEFLVY